MLICDVCEQLFKKWQDAIQEYSNLVQVLAHASKEYFYQLYEEVSRAQEMVIGTRVAFEHHRQEHDLALGSP